MSELTEINTIIKPRTCLTTTYCQVPPMTQRSKLFPRLNDPSLLLATIATIAYYAIVLLPPFHDSILYRYTTQHLVEYVIVAMFMWGMIDILLKAALLPKENWALEREWVPPRAAKVSAQHAAALLEQVRSQPPRYLQTRVGQRFIQALTFVIENQSAEEFPDYLRYLADQDDEVTYRRYALIRFVVAVTPILGFLGTVVHFGTALSGISFSELDTGLEHVVGEMGTAFNTTTVALGAAMVAMFAMFLCERLEHGICARIDRYVERELQNRFEVKDPNLLPFLATLSDAHKEFQVAVQQSLSSQVALWSTALQALFEQFDKRQKTEEQRWKSVCDDLSNRQQSYDADYDRRLRQIVSIADAKQDQHLAQIQSVLDRAGGFSHEVEALAKTLQSIARGEGRLNELQVALTENLRVLHETHKIDAALHGLTAAIHLLTARNHAGPISNAA